MSCSGCGHILAELRLQDSRWTCHACRTQHDRGQSEAINFKREGRQLLATGSRDTNTAPDGGRPTLARNDTQGETASAAGKNSPVGQPSSMNCVQPYRAAPPVGGKDRTRRLGRAETPNEWFGSVMDAPLLTPKVGRRGDPNRRPVTK